MVKPTLDMNLLAPLDALLQTRSVTLAAHRLGISQSTMSGMLARLREQFHDPLLARVGRNMELTPLGVQIAGAVRQILLEAVQLTAPRDAFDPGVSEWRLRLMTSEEGLFLVMPELFRRLIRNAPKIVIEVLPIERPSESVYEGNVDICLTGDAISGLRAESASIVRTQTLFQESFVAVVDDEHPLGDIVELDDFRRYPHVATQFPGSARTVGDVGLSNFSLLYPPTLRVPSFLAVGGLIVGSHAIGIMPSRLVPLLGFGSRLRAIAMPPEFPLYPFRALWHARYDGDAAHRWLRSQIVEICNLVKQDAGVVPQRHR